MNDLTINQVVYIHASREQVWDALTNPAVTKKYWFETSIESDWKKGSAIQYVRNGQVTDEHVILSVVPNALLQHTFHPISTDEFKNEPPSQVTITLTENNEVVKLELTHNQFVDNSKVYLSCNEGWPLILSNLKMFLETGKTPAAFDVG